jgi:hypothetical protein
MTNINLEKNSASVGFIKKKFIAMFIRADKTFTLLPVFFVFKKRL